MFARNPKVSHFDCTATTENTLSAVNHGRQCHITSEELELSETKIIYYTEDLRIELKATKCRIQHQREKWPCRHNDHSSIDHTIAEIERDYVISPEQCRSLPKGKMIYLGEQCWEVEYSTKNLIVIFDGVTSRIKGIILTEDVRLPSVYSFFIGKKRHLRSKCSLRMSYPIQIKYCFVHWKS